MKAEPYKGYKAIKKTLRRCFFAALREIVNRKDAKIHKAHKEFPLNDCQYSIINN